MRRALCPAELTVDAMDRAATLNTVGVPRVRGPFEVEALARALRRLEQRHPLLRARVERHARGADFVYGEGTPIPLRVIDAARDSWREQACAALAYRSWPDEGPRAALTVLQHPDASSSWLLTLHHLIGDGYSCVALSPRPGLPAAWFGVGPLRADSDTAPPFPFERLDGRPLVYASMGTLQGARRSVFAAIAEACAPLDAQLIITHGNQLRDEETRGFAGDPIVVPYAPQRPLLERSALAITHAGLNTVLDALHAGVPMLTIPITFEQPAIAARVAWHGAGEVIPFKRVRVQTLREAARRILTNQRYRDAAVSLGRRMASTGGVHTAADVIERVVRAP